MARRDEIRTDRDGVCPAELEVKRDVLPLLVAVLDEVLECSKVLDPRQVAPDKVSLALRGTAKQRL